MKKRTRELAEQAGFKFYRDDDQVVFARGEPCDPERFTSEMFEKFANLVAQDTLNPLPHPDPIVRLYEHYDCYDCFVKKYTDPHDQMMNMRMIVCSTCGNKRCPKATNHELTCTGSNEPGQKGSRYE
jgi:DNA-directed RNA polymerase subunit RPC12/RpoP